MLHFLCSLRLANGFVIVAPAIIISFFFVSRKFSNKFLKTLILFVVGGPVLHKMKVIDAF